MRNCKSFGNIPSDHKNHYSDGLMMGSDLIDHNQYQNENFEAFDSGEKYKNDAALSNLKIEN